MGDEDPTESVPDGEVARPAEQLPATTAIPGSVRQDLAAAAQRDLGRTDQPVLIHLEEVLAADERVDALSFCDPKGSILTATDQRLLLAKPGAADVVAIAYDGLRDVVVLPFGKQAVVCPLRVGEVFEGWVAPREGAKKLVGYARERLVALRKDSGGGKAWYDDPAFTLGARYDDAALIVVPEGALIPGRTSVVASFVTTGVQLTTVGQPAGVEPTRAFVPWDAVESATLEPPEQSTHRPGVSEAIALGVPGASKRASNKRAILALGAGRGEYVIVLRGYTLHDTAGVLQPMLSRLPGATVSQPVQPPPATTAGRVGAAAAGDDPVAQIRRLAELRDEGLLTAEEFEAKKTELLKRI